MQSRIEAAISDLGGLDSLTQFEKDLLERAAHAVGLAEKEEARMRAGEQPDLQAWFGAVDRFAKIAGMLGLRRRTRDLELGDALAETAPSIAAHGADVTDA